MRNPIINLYQFDGIGLIVSHSTGILYSNQTGGYACLSPELEGTFVPLKDSLVNQQEQLKNILPARNGKDVATAVLI